MPALAVPPASGRGVKENLCSIRKQWKSSGAAKTLKLETGRVARQADGAVLATLGETVVLCAVTAAKSVKPGQDFFPLTVHYQEKFCAADASPAASSSGSAERPKRKRLPAASSTARSARCSRKASTTRSSCIAQVLCYDGENEPDVPAMVAASAALTLSGVPFMGPIGGARVGLSTAITSLIRPKPRSPKASSTWSSPEPTTR